MNSRGTADDRPQPERAIWHLYSILCYEIWKLEDLHYGTRQIINPLIHLNNDIEFYEE